MLSSGSSSEVRLAQLPLVPWLAGHMGREWGVRVRYCPRRPELPTAEQSAVFSPRVNCQIFLLFRVHNVCWCHIAEQAVGLDVFMCTCRYTVTHQIFVLLSQVCLVRVAWGFSALLLESGRLPGLHPILPHGWADLGMSLPLSTLLFLPIN